MIATVTFHRREYTGELLYLHTFPLRVLDKKGNVIGTERVPQRVGLLIDGVSTHFTIPEEVRL